MKLRPTALHCFLYFVFLFITHNAYAVTVETPSAVSQTTISSKLDEAQSSTSLDETAKTRLIELYQKSLAFLKSAEANSATAKEYRKAKQSAPVETDALHADIDKNKSKNPIETLPISDKPPLAETEQYLLKEKANRAAVDAKLSELEQHLLDQSERPTIAGKRLTEAKNRQQALSDQLKQPSAQNEDAFSLANR